jgi:predicted DNA-binding protein
MKLNKHENLVIRIDSNMKKAIEEIAKKDRRPLSNYVRLLIENDIIKKSNEKI